jgi:hypothetical protein
VPMTAMRGRPAIYLLLLSFRSAQRADRDRMNTEP